MQEAANYYVSIVYYVNMGLILGLAVPLCIRKPARWKSVLYLAVTFGFMWFLSTFRLDIGFDYNAYWEIFLQIKNCVTLADYRALPFEPAFVALNKLLSLFVPNAVVMYAIYNVIILVPIAWFIYRYSKDIWLSTWLFVAITFYYTTMNFARQSLAIAVSVLAYKFLRERKPIPYFAIVLLAAGFHKTALILIPIYFLCTLKLTPLLGALYGGAALIFYLTSEFIVDFVTNFIFKGYKGTIWLTEGFPLRYLFVPFILFGTCLALKWVWEKRDPDATMLLNMMLYSAIIWLFITRHFILERFSPFVYIYALLAVPAALSSLKSAPEVYEKRDRLAAELKAKKAKPGKEQTAALAKLTQDISDHQKYYWCAVAAILIVTFIYHDYGGNVNGFHGVFPYKSVFPWLVN